MYNPDHKPDLQKLFFLKNKTKKYGCYDSNIQAHHVVITTITLNDVVASLSWDKGFVAST